MKEPTTPLRKGGLRRTQSKKIAHQLPVFDSVHGVQLCVKCLATGLTLVNGSEHRFFIGWFA